MREMLPSKRKVTLIWKYSFLSLKINWDQGRGNCSSEFWKYLSLEPFSCSLPHICEFGDRVDLQRINLRTTQLRTLTYLPWQVMTWHNTHASLSDIQKLENQSLLCVYSIGVDFSPSYSFIPISWMSPPFPLSEDHPRCPAGLMNYLQLDRFSSQVH